MAKFLVSKFIILLLLAALIPTKLLVNPVSAEGEVLELSVPDVVNALQAFPITVSINDPSIMKEANHFEFGTSPRTYNVSGYYLNYNELRYVENNYNGEEKLEFKAKLFYPSLMTSTKDGLLGSVQVSFYKVTLLGNLPKIDEKAFNASKGSLYTWRLPNGTYDHYKKSLIASASKTFNLVPLLVDIELPDYPEKYNKSQTFSRGVRFHYQVDTTHYNIDDIYNVEVTEINRWENSNSLKKPDLKKFMEEDYYYLDLWFGPTTQGGYEEDILDPAKWNATEVLTRTDYGFQTVSVGTGQQDFYGVVSFTMIQSTKNNYTLGIRIQREGLTSLGNGAQAVEDTKAESLAILKSIKLRNNLANVKPTTLTVTGGGSGINLAIIPVSLTDAPNNFSKAEIEAVGAKLVEYYKEVSYGKIYVNVKVIDKDGSWLTIPKSKNVYGNSTAAFFKDAITAVDDSVDFTSYDYDSTNGKGIVAFVTEPKLFPGAFITTNHSPNGAFETKEGVKVDAIYMFRQRIDPAPGYSGMARALCHEFGHALGKLTVTSVQGGSKGEAWTLPDEYLIGNVKCYQSLMGNLESYLVEKIHPSSYLKQWLGWLTYQPAPTNSTFTITALDKLSYGSSVYTIDYSGPGGLHGSYIIEYRNALTSSKWDTEFSQDATSGIRKEVVVYQLETNNAGVSLNLAGRMHEEDGVLYVEEQTLKDPVRKIEITPVKLEAATATLQYTSYKPVNLVGAVASPVASPPLPNVPNDEREFTLPDTDLHAYTTDGKHIGVNYLTARA